MAGTGVQELVLSGAVGERVDVILVFFLFQDCFCKSFSHFVTLYPQTSVNWTGGFVIKHDKTGGLQYLY